MKNKLNQTTRNQHTSFNPNSTYDTILGLSSNGNTSAGFKTNQFKSTLA